MTTIADKLKDKFKAMVTGDEPAMLADAIEALLPLIETVFLLAMLGTMLDVFFNMVNLNASGLYTADDIKCMGTLYSLVHYCPHIAIISGILYIYTKSNLAKGT